MAYTNNKNPFYTGDDDDYGASSRKRDPFMDDAENEFNQIQDLRQQSMNRQLASTERCMASIYDSERMGITTAEELVHQGEQLDNVETKLDKINQDVKTSQRHINSIKSVFGGIKNWWSGNKEATTKEPVKSDRAERLEATIEHSSQAQGSHPALRNKSEDGRGFYDDDEPYGRGSSASTKYGQSTQAYSSDLSPQDNHWKEYDQQLDSNMDVLSSGLSRLKNLGLGLGDEIEKQNTQLDRIENKTDRANVTIGEQNRQMRHILKK